MNMHRFTPALTLPVLLCFAAPALAEPSCSGGGYVADAVISPLAEIGTIATATQYAWDGGGRLVNVCNLLTEGADFSATWSIFSGEVDAVYPGICVSLTNSAGVEWFSCQVPDAVTAAFTAPTGTDAAVLRFEAWEPQAPTLQ